MADLDEFTKSLLDKIINNVISCLPMIEKMFKDQNKQLGKDIGIVNRKDFILGAVWCIILEKYIITCYLHTGKTINYENGMEISRYVLNKISKSDHLMSINNG
ncbi:MAG TPA: hypothetical protein VFU67_06385 [Nitrososphaeraceae archaeon]|nr:hypothetical protein [Nitrososphaeraceae archaeon]